MLIPIGDDDRRLAGPAFVTVGLVMANLLAFFLWQGAGANQIAMYGWSVIPVEITQGIDLVQTQYVDAGGRSVPVPQAPGPTPVYLTILTAMFMHGGYAHLFGNLLYLWIFGDNVEHRLGGWRFFGFYVFCGIAATLIQVATAPDGVIPNLGASGAIAGVLGAYMVFFPKNRVHALFIYAIVSVPSIVAIGLWVAFQFFNGYGAIMETQQLGGVAYGAHIGGFLTGALLAGVVRLAGIWSPSSSSPPEPREHAGDLPRRW
ncbi:rhomboid family intramembrane serine protease [Longibacter salinarum]|uniref:Rhomboid family intramembrane serine protease n=1 Tax=Longibacter salinarum TaxID=1850348 RepID=A0A2A8D224_9BACT|nr:rhomboid family intramembrane serine protease [Longibacter salinarum]PEN14934.1 rhomboid family intramembrane serine protease [Longibacter salinarum]